MYGSFVDDWKTPDEYISKKAAVKAIAAAMPSMSTPDGSGENDHLVLAAQEMCVGAIKAVREVRPANVIRAKRAHWIVSETDYGFCESIGKNYKGRKYKCSACGYETGTQAEKFVCCPICTAKMDGGTP